MRACGCGRCGARRTSGGAGAPLCRLPSGAVAAHAAGPCPAAKPPTAPRHGAEHRQSYCAAQPNALVRSAPAEHRQSPALPPHLPAASPTDRQTGGEQLKALNPAPPRRWQVHAPVGSSPASARPARACAWRLWCSLVTPTLPPLPRPHQASGGLYYSLTHDRIGPTGSLTYMVGSQRSFAAAPPAGSARRQRRHADAPSAPASHPAPGGNPATP